MGTFDLLIHLSSFAAPALAVALVLAFAGRWLRGAGPAGRWWLHLAINFAAGLAALAAGLWYFGTDGKMASYAALVAACATSQWITGRGWR